ncbi:hypothetical protein [Nostoc sp.]
MEKFLRLACSIVGDRYDGLPLRIYIDERKAIATTRYAYAQSQCFNYELVV